MFCKIKILHVSLEKACKDCGAIHANSGFQLTNDQIPNQGFL